MPAARAARNPESGFSLAEAIVATVIATIAVMGLAWSIGTGRSLVDRYEVARQALGVAQARLEKLAADGPAGTGLRLTENGAPPHVNDVPLEGGNVLHEEWTVVRVDEPANGLSGAHIDLKRVTVTVWWGERRPAETVVLSRLYATR